MFQQQQAQRGVEQREEQPLLVAAGEGVGRRLRLADDLVGLDAVVHFVAVLFPVDEKALLGAGQHQVFGQAQPGHQPFFQPPGGHVAHAVILQAVVAPAGHVLAAQLDAAAVGRQQPGADLHHQPLAAALQPGETKNLPGAYGEINVRYCQLVGLDGHVPQFEFGLAHGEGRPGGALGGLAEHHLDQLFVQAGQLLLAHQLAAPQDEGVEAQVLHLFQLVGNEDDRLALFAGHLAHGVEEDFFLLGADAGGRFVEDEHLRAAGQQPHQFQLLPLAHREGVDAGVDVQLEAVARGQPLQLGAGGAVVEAQAVVAPQQVVVDHAEGGHVQRVLVEHPDALGQRVGRGMEGHRLAIQQDIAAGGRLIAGENLHQRALARAVLPHQGINLARLQHHVDAVVGLHRTEVLADIP